MKKHIRLIAGAAMIAAMGISAPSFANHEPGHDGRPEMHENCMDGKHDMKDMHAKLRDALKITPAQEAAWKKFDESMPKPPKRDAKDREDFAKLTMPQRADRMVEQHGKQLDAMKSHVAAMKDLYATLSPEQKKTFDGFHDQMAKEHADHQHHPDDHRMPPPEGRRPPPMR